MGELYFFFSFVFFFPSFFKRSSRISLGGTRVLGAVYGPAESMARDELVEKAAIEVIYRTTRVEEEAKEAEEALARAIDAVCLATLHPRTAIRIVLQVLVDDGSSFSAVANAACVALLDAGIQLNTVFVAATCAVMEDGSVLVDPSMKEQDKARAVVDLVFDGSLEGILVSRCRGEFRTSKEYFDCVEMAAKMCKALLKFVRKTTEGRFNA